MYILYICILYIVLDIYQLVAITTHLFLLHIPINRIETSGGEDETIRRRQNQKANRREESQRDEWKQRSSKGRSR